MGRSIRFRSWHYRMNFLSLVDTPGTVNSACSPIIDERILQRTKSHRVPTKPARHVVTENNDFLSWPKESQPRRISGPDCFPPSLSSHCFFRFDVGSSKGAFDSRSEELRYRVLRKYCGSSGGESRSPRVVITRNEDKSSILEHRWVIRQNRGESIKVLLIFNTSTTATSCHNRIADKVADKDDNHWGLLCSIRSIKTKNFPQSLEGHRII